MKEDLGVSNAQAWGCPRGIPFFINNYQFVPRSTIFLSLHALCALLGASCSLLFQVCFAFFDVVTSYTPTYSFVWERNTLRLNQNSSQDLHAFSFSRELFFFFLSCWSVQLQSFSFLELCFCFRLNFLQVACFILLESFPIALSSVS